MHKNNFQLHMHFRFYFNVTNLENINVFQIITLLVSYIILYLNGVILKGPLLSPLSKLEIFYFLYLSCDSIYFLTSVMDVV